MDYFSITTPCRQVHIGVATIEALEVDFSCLMAKDNPKANIGSVACRQLLWHLQTHLNLIQPYQRLVLHENQFPYYFMANNIVTETEDCYKVGERNCTNSTASEPNAVATSAFADYKTYWVSFSHSQSQVAVMVVCDDNKNVPPKFGIDIEDKRISEAVARRFFCDEEWDWLASLESQQTLQAKKLLWTLKESLIKAEVKEKLVLGLKNNLLALIGEQALNDLLQDNENGFNQVNTENGIFGFSPRFKCGFVLLG